MRSVLIPLSVGVLFAFGLGLSGMTQPQKVVGFLDIFGSWDPSLAFVMVGAILVHALTYQMIRNRPSPLLEKQWHLPTRKKLTPPLFLGGFLFGVGWGLAGYCPGPALTSVASFQARPLIFVSSMLLGMFLFHQIDKKLKLEK